MLIVIILSLVYEGKKEKQIVKDPGIKVCLNTVQKWWFDLFHRVILIIIK